MSKLFGAGYASPAADVRLSNLGRPRRALPSNLHHGNADRLARWPLSVFSDLGANGRRRPTPHGPSAAQNPECRTQKDGGDGGTHDDVRPR